MWPANWKCVLTEQLTVLYIKTSYSIVVFSFSRGATTPIGGCILQPSSGLRPSRLRGFMITHNDAPQSVGLL